MLSCFSIYNIELEIINYQNIKEASMYNKTVLALWDT